MYRSKLLVTSLVVLFSAPAVTSAANYYWTGGLAGNWDSGANWSLTLPVNGNPLPADAGSYPNSSADSAFFVRHEDPSGPDGLEYGNAVITIGTPVTVAGVDQGGNETENLTFSGSSMTLNNAVGDAFIVTGRNLTWTQNPVILNDDVVVTTAGPASDRTWYVTGGLSDVGSSDITVQDRARFALEGAGAINGDLFINSAHNDGGAAFYSNWSSNSIVLNYTDITLTTSGIMKVADPSLVAGIPLYGNGRVGIDGANANPWQITDIVSPGISGAGTILFGPGYQNPTLGVDLAAGTVYQFGAGDLLSITGALNSTGAWILQAAGLAAGPYTVATANLGVGASAVSNGTVTGVDGSLSIDGNNLVLTVVPEPASLSLLALLGLAFGHRRRR